MAKDKKIPDEDIQLFRDAMKHARPLRHSRTTHARKRPHPVPRQRMQDELQVLDDMLSDEYDVADVETGEELMFVRPGLQHNVLRRLRRGQFPVESELDLHGQTANTARIEMTAFLHDCLQRHLRCVRIVHGKGYGSKNQKPVLKNKVNNWLRQRNEVLAFCSTPHNDGGTGAVYVLLKSK